MINVTKIKHKTIRFKSIPENWNKENLGLKRNTVRKKDTDYRFKILDYWLCAKLESLTVEIENTNSGEYFSRRVMDVTKLDDYYIISW